MSEVKNSLGAIRLTAGLGALALVVQACAAPRTPTAPVSLPTPGEGSGAGSTKLSQAPAERPSDGGWVASPHPDLRRLTVLIRVKPPDELVAKYGELAARDKRLKTWFQAAAEGGFGSGFVVVRRDASDANKPPSARKFIVTNRHVVDLATRVAVSFDGSKDAIEVPVVYVDPAYDLAVLSLDRASGDASVLATIPEGGFDFERSPAKDQQPVVASGYPAIGEDPSYQVTRGYVSNERFEVTEGGHPQLYVQHTAPIDPGSSGGPLTTPEGKLLGVNTMKVRRRENAGFAVPAAAVADAVKRAAMTADRAERPTSPAEARAACDELLAALAHGQEDLGTVERAIGGSMVARDGFASLDELPRADVDWVQAFVEAPTQVFLHAIALRLLSEVPEAKAKAEAPTCKPVAGRTEAGTQSFNVRTRHGERAWVFGWEQQRWKVVNGSLPAGRRSDSFFRDDGAPKGTRKKWTPSFK